MNPILKKDLLAVFRSLVVGALQTTFIAVLAGLVIATWPQGGMVPIGSAARNDVLLLLTVGQLAMLGLFIPGVAALSVVGERVGGTWEMLYASRLSARDVILGKLLGTLALPAMLLACGLPFMALLYCRGDLDLSAVLWVYVILLLSGVLLTLIPMAISALCRDASTALVLSYLVVVGLAGGVLVPAAIMLQTQEGVAALALHGFRAISPISAVYSLLQPQPGDFDGSQHGLVSSWRIFLPTAAILIAITTMIIIRSLSRLEHVRSEARGSRFANRSQRQPLGRGNPMLGKERRTNRLGQTGWIARTFYIALTLSLSLAVMSLYGGMAHPDVLQYVAKVLICLQIGVVALIAPALTSSAIVSERESQTLELLRLTPLRCGEVFWGKLLPPLVPGIVLVLALIPAYGAICLINSIYLHVFYRLAGVVGMTLIICCVVGLTASAWAQTSVQATLGAYIAVTTLIILPAAVWWTSGALLDPRLSGQIAQLSPLVVALSLLPGASNDSFAVLRNHLLWMGVLAMLLLIVSRWRLGLWLSREEAVR